MPAKYDLIIEQPISALNTPLKIDLKAFFFSLTKAVVAGSFGDFKGGIEYGVDALQEAGLKDDTPAVAWTLISKSLMQAVSTLAADYQDLLTEEPDEKAITDLAGRIEYRLNTVEVSLDASFFEQPQNLSLLDDFKPTLEIWLTKLGMDEFQIDSFHQRLKGQFVLALHEEWGRYADDYRCLIDQLETPFTKATLEQRSWGKYNAWLQEQANTRVFGEAFGLQQVYIRLRAFYEERTTDKHHREEIQKVTCDLHSEIEHWIKHFNRDDSLRVVSGGPGSGKSSFAKILAAELAEKQTLPVLFIPLHHFSLNDDLIPAVANFVRDDPYLRGNPLDPKDGQKRLLIIFDGLDELSMQGKAADAAAQEFVEEVIRTLNKYNNGSIQWQALVTGRELAVQANTSRLRKSCQILHALPYHLDEHEIKGYADSKRLLEKDQRNDWWRLYGKAKGKDYKGLPTELAIDHLQPITREPLLNYLISLSFERERIIFDDNISLNTIYYDLLEAVYDRQYEDHKHSGSKHLEFKDFLRVLEEIALAVWHGNGRTASAAYLVQRCKESRLDRYLEAFSSDAKSGVVRLLTAFYFREFGKDDSGDQTFEFTHKSFGEYLTARRIVKQVKLTAEEMQRNAQHGDAGWSPEVALVKWIKVCGPTAIDDYLLRFIKDEILHENKEQGADLVEKWQTVFLSLLSLVVRNNSPIEKLGLATFSEMLVLSRNSEEALLVIHYACALVTKQVKEVNWGAETNLGSWLKRMQGQRSTGENPMTLGATAYLSCSNQALYMADLWESNLRYSHFRNSNMAHANLYRANLVGVNLVDTNLILANLLGANLARANLEKANLERANLQGANLQGADLKGADLKRADLEGADLEGANLERANLEGANLEGANLKGSNLKETNIEKAKGKYNR